MNSSASAPPMNLDPVFISASDLITLLCDPDEAAATIVVDVRDEVRSGAIMHACSCDLLCLFCATLFPCSVWIPRVSCCVRGFGEIALGSISNAPIDCNVVTGKLIVFCY